VRLTNLSPGHGVKNNKEKRLNRTFFGFRALFEGFEDTFNLTFILPRISKILEIEMRWIGGIFRKEH
jgi:hypothetical protein